MKENIYICIPVHNRLNLTIQCLKSIFKQTYKYFHVIISDAESTDGTYEVITKSFPEKVSVIRIDKSNWWTGGINECVKYALQLGNENDFIFTLNNDTELSENCLEELILFATNNRNLIIGCINLFYNDHSRIESSAFLNKRLYPFYIQKRLFEFGQTIPINILESYHVNGLSGKGVLIPVSIFKKIGLYDQKLLPHYHADTEFIQRCGKKGYYSVLLTKARLFSHVTETGLGTIDKSFTNFIKGFFSIKSALYIKSTFFYSKMVYGESWFLYFFPYYSFVIIGYFKRLLTKKM